MVPFGQAGNAAVICCRCMMDQDRPSLRIPRDAEGDWQFLCGGVHGAADAMAVLLREVYGLDNTVAGAAGPDTLQAAVRDTQQDKWQVVPVLYAANLKNAIFKHSRVCANEAAYAAFAPYIGTARDEIAQAGFACHLKPYWVSSAVTI